ncbi:MFS transporter, partial [Pseudomonas aeruginosa]
FFIYGSADEYFTYALLFLGILLHGVSYDFYYVTAYIYVDKKAPVHMRTAAQGLITLCCQGFGSLLGYRLGGVMMEKMFAYQEPVNGLTFNWAGMW